jgi:hypothetical protein
MEIRATGPRTRNAPQALLHRIATGLLAVAAVIGGGGSAAGQPTPPPGAYCPRVTPPGVPGNIPASSSCCGQFQCAAGVESDGLANDRRNVVIAILDDHGHCQYGFMGGRCAGPATGQTMRRCDSSSECPNEVACVHGYCAQCNEDGDCGGDLCLEGLCSPRASCTGDFECARGIGSCGRTCAISGDPCDDETPCGAGDSCGSPHCERTDGLVIACSTDADCHDECGDDNLCVRTPRACGPNSDCDESERCTTSDRPLRLNDLSCRYRQPGDARWEYDMEGPLPTPGEQNVFTPHIDELAREGAVFSRARVNGQNCKPTRAAMLLGTFLRHRPAMESESCPNGTEETFACRLDDKNGTDPEYHEIAAGKTELAAGPSIGFDTEFQDGSSPSFGKYECEEATCGAALDVGAIPHAALQDGVPNSLDGVIDRFRQNLGAPNDTVVNEPVVLWYAPKIPHEGSSAGPYFQELYRLPGTKVDEGEGHLARTSRFDSGLEALTDELKRTCICPPPLDVPPPSPSPRPMESLYEHTTVIVTADNAFLLPQAKNDSGHGGENAHRTAVVINDPDDRADGSGRVVDAFTDDDDAPEADFAGSGAPDLFPTILDYATGGDLPAGIPDYPFRTSLRPLADGGSTVRRIYYGHAVNGTDMDRTQVGQRAYMIPGPGVLGRCEGTSTVCLVDGDVGCASGVECRHLLCANDPLRSCHDEEGLPSDALCAVGFCEDDTCSLTLAPADFRSRTCTTGIDCVPAGICRPLLLKAVQTGSATTRTVTDMFDLNDDPDETRDLITSSTNPLGSLADEVNDCIERFWCDPLSALQTAPMDDLASGCGDPIGPCT